MPREEYHQNKQPGLRMKFRKAIWITTLIATTAIIAGSILAEPFGFPSWLQITLACFAVLAAVLLERAARGLSQWLDHVIGAGDMYLRKGEARTACTIETTYTVTAPQSTMPDIARALGGGFHQDGYGLTNNATKGHLIRLMPGIHEHPDDEPEIEIKVSQEASNAKGLAKKLLAQGVQTAKLVPKLPSDCQIISQKCQVIPVHGFIDKHPHDQARIQYGRRAVVIHDLDQDLAEQVEDFVASSASGPQR